MRAGTFVSIVSAVAFMPRDIRNRASSNLAIVATIGDVLACRVFGHRYRFWAEGRTMRWECARACGAASAKEYPTAEDATRYATAFDREDRDELGRRAPLSLLPLRLARRLAQRR
jgi:hypothetical protein